MLQDSFFLVDIYVDVKNLTRRFVNNGFPRWIVNQCINKVIEKFHYSSNSPRPPNVPRDKIIISLPYLGHLSYLLKRNLTSLLSKFYPTCEIRVVFQRGLKIGNLLSHEDKLPKSCASFVVYSSCCKQCGLSKAYLGKTKNTLHERFYGSNGHLNPNTKNSALLEHCLSNPACDFVFDEVRVVDNAKSEYQLKYMESIYLKLNLEPQNLNTQEWSTPLKIF